MATEFEKQRIAELEKEKAEWEKETVRRIQEDGYVVLKEKDAKKPSYPSYKEVAEQIPYTNESFLNKHGMSFPKSTPTEEPIKKQSSLSKFFDISDSGFVANLGRSTKKEEPLVNKSEQLRNIPATIGTPTESQQRIIDLPEEEKKQAIELFEFKEKVNNFVKGIGDFYKGIKAQGIINRDLTPRKIRKTEDEVDRIIASGDLSKLRQPEEYKNQTTIGPVPETSKAYETGRTVAKIENQITSFIEDVAYTTGLQALGVPAPISWGTIRGARNFSVQGDPQKAFKEGVSSTVFSGVLGVAKKPVEQFGFKLLEKAPPELKNSLVADWMVRVGSAMIVAPIASTSSYQVENFGDIPDIKDLMLSSAMAGVLSAYPSYMQSLASNQALYLKFNNAGKQIDSLNRQIYEINTSKGIYNTNNVHTKDLLLKEKQLINDLLKDTSKRMVGVSPAEQKRLKEFLEFAKRVNQEKINNVAKIGEPPKRITTTGTQFTEIKNEISAMNEYIKNTTADGNLVQPSQPQEEPLRPIEPQVTPTEEPLVTTKPQLEPQRQDTTQVTPQVKPQDIKQATQQEKQKTKVPEGLTFEEAQKQIDNYEDTLVAKYKNEDVLLDLVDRSMGEKTISTDEEMNKLQELYDIRDKIEDNQINKDVSEIMQRIPFISNQTKNNDWLAPKESVEKLLKKMAYDSPRYYEGKKFDIEEFKQDLYNKLIQTTRAPEELWGEYDNAKRIDSIDGFGPFGKSIRPFLRQIDDIVNAVLGVPQNTRTEPKQITSQVEPEVKPKSKATEKILDVPKEDVKNELVETVSEVDLSKSVRFKKEFIDIKLRDGSIENVAAETYKGISVEKNTEGKGYNVTHIKSSLKIREFDNKEQAKVYARVLADTFNVDVPLEEFTKTFLDNKEAKKYFEDLTIWVEDNVNTLGKKKNNIIELEKILTDVRDNKFTPDDLMNRIDIVGNDVSGFNFYMRQQIMEELINGIKKDTSSIDFKVDGDGYLEIRNTPESIAKILTALKLKLKPKGPPTFSTNPKVDSKPVPKVDVEKEVKPKAEVKPIKKKDSKTQAMARQIKDTISKRIDQKTKDRFFSEPVSRSEIENLVSELLDIPVSQGKFRQRALGIFKVKPEAIRLKRTKDLDVLFHEVGHFLDKKLNLSNPKFESELLRLGAATSRASYTKDTIMKEGVAEFFRLFITNSSEAIKIAPEFTKHFNKLISNNETMKDFVKTMQTAVKNYIDQDAKHRVLGNISIKPNRRKLNIKQMWEKFYTLMVDDVKPLERVVKSIIGNVSIAVTKNPYELVSIYRGRSTGLAKTFLEHGVVDNLGNKISKGLKEILEPIANEINDFRVYIVSVRALELYHRGIETGLLKKDLVENIEKLESDKFKKVFKELIEYQDHTLRQLVESGILSEKDFNNIKDMNKYYIPFYRVMNEATGGKGTGFQAYDPAKNIKGSTRDIVDPIESIIKNTYLYIDLAERNKIGKSFAELTREFDGTGKFIEEIPPDMHGKTFNLKEIKTPLKQVLEAEGIDIEEIDLDNLATIFRPVRPKGDLKVITIYENGKPSYYQVHDAPLYRAFMQLGKKPTESWMKIFTIPAQILRKGALLTPEFITRNPVKDSLDAMIYSTYGFKMGIDSIAHVFDVIGKKELYYKWLSSGAAMSDIQAMDRIGLQIKAEDIMHKGFKKAYLNPLNVLSSLTQMSEETTRVGDFVLGLEKEMAKNDGVLTEEIVRKVALSSRRLVLDYNRAGEWGRIINQIVAFFNATVQGTDKIARIINAGIKGNKTERARAYAVILKAILTITVPTILLYMINRDDEEYKDTDAWVKDTHWLIKRNDEGGFIRIPRPYGTADLFATLPERILRYIDQEDPKAFDGMSERLIQTFFGVNIKQSPYVPLPNLINPLIEVGTNYSFFFQNPIVPKQELQLDNYAQYGKSTSELAKTLGKIFDYSPRKIDHLFIGYGAGLARYTLDIIDKGYSLVGKSDKPIFPERMSEYPVIKGFTYESVKIYTETTKDFYNDLNRLESDYATQRRLNKIELDDYSKASELRKFRWISKYLSDKRKQISIMQENKKSTKEINLEILRMINVVREEMGRIPLNTDAGYDEMAWDYKGKYLASEFKREHIKDEPSILSLVGFDASVLDGPRATLYKTLVDTIQSDDYTVEQKLNIIKGIELAGRTLTEGGLERIIQNAIK